MSDPAGAALIKVLSANDTGGSGSHQAGILLPKSSAMLAFFPTLNENSHNPRAMVLCLDDDGREWRFNYIHYNNVLLGGTRNEYRLTSMTAFLRTNKLREGDALVFWRDSTNTRRLSIRRREKPTAVPEAERYVETALPLSIPQPAETNREGQGGQMEQRSTEVTPDPARMVESLRDTGYTFSTAIADLVDNSVAAGATLIQVNVAMDFAGKIDVFVADNGSGMNEDALIDAMRYGSSERPDPHSLGKFGIGLKTASTSFCRQLSVVTRPASAHPSLKATWDLDHIVRTSRWELLFSDPSPYEQDKLDRCAGSGTGTLVHWSGVDRLIKQYKEPGGKWAQDALERQVKELREHLGMVFQRFLDKEDPRESHKIQIQVNGTPVSHWDPFVVAESELVGSEVRQVSGMDGSTAGEAVIHAYILPTREQFSTPQAATEARLTNDNQGIYVYRENRLIHNADWMGITIKEPHRTLLRIEFSFGAELDEAFQVDIKKSRISLNDQLFDWLRDEFLPPLRREAENRYRKGKSRRENPDAHAGSNRRIGDHDAEIPQPDVEVLDETEGRVRVSNLEGEAIINMDVVNTDSSDKPYVMTVDQIEDGLLWEPAVVGPKRLAVKLNTRHQFYRKVYLPEIQSKDSSNITVQGIDCLIWSLAIAELRTVTEAVHESFVDLRMEVSRILRKLVADMPEPRETVNDDDH
jgi:hypothetical protein